MKTIMKSTLRNSMLCLCLTASSSLLQAQNAAPKPPTLPGLTQMDQLIPNEEWIYSVHGFEGAHSLQKELNLNRFIVEEINRHENNLKAFRALSRAERKEKEEQIETSETAIEFLKHSLAVLKNGSNSPAAFALARRVVSSVLILDREYLKTREPYTNAFLPQPSTQPALNPAEQQFLNGELQKLMLGLKSILPPSLLANGAPPAPLVAKVTERVQRLLVPQANVALSTEAPQGLADLSQVRPDHPSWKSAQYLPRSAQAAWAELEAFHNHKVTAATGIRYDISQAPKILFMDEIRTNATSPKIKVRDYAGQVWNLKSGDEIQPTVIGNRVQMALGAKLADPAYEVRGAEMTLVLPEKIEKLVSSEESKGKNHVEALIYAMMTSGYQYNIADNIAKHGQIDRAIYDSLPSLIRSQISYDSVKGRSFVQLKDAAVVFKPRQGILVGSGVALGSQFARQDGVYRRSVLLHLLFGNRDNKDDNNRSALIEFNPGEEHLLPSIPKVRGKDGKLRSYVEYAKDFGNSMGQMFAAGDITKLKGENLTELRQENDGSQTLRFAEGLLYVPKCWNSATVPEILEEVGAAAQLMGSLMLNEAKYSDFAWIVDQTRWPRFMKMAVMNRLVERTRGILKQIEKAGLEVRTRDGRILRSAETHSYTPDYVLTKNEIPKLAAETGVHPKSLTGSENVVLLSKGVLVENGGPQHEALIRKLEVEQYPNGLLYRVSRTLDHLPQTLESKIPAAGMMAIFKRPSAEELKVLADEAIARHRKNASQ